jgi:drug/metabolite transporter (DMT)-like permease
MSIEIMTRRTQGILLLLLSTTFNIAMPFVMVAADVPPPVNAFFRAIFAVPTLFVIGVLGAKYGSEDLALERPGRRWGIILILGILHGLAFLTSAGSLLLTDPAVDRLLGRSTPMWTIALSAIWFREKISPRTYLGFILAATSTVLVILPMLSGEGYPVYAYAAGIVTPLIAAIIWTLSGRERYLKDEYTAVSKSFYQNAIGAPVLLIPLLISGGELTRVSARDWVVLILLGAIFVPAVFITNFAGQKRLPEADQQRFTLLTAWSTPAVLVIESLRQGQWLSPTMWAAMAVALMGYFVTIWPARKTDHR